MFSTNIAILLVVVVGAVAFAAPVEEELYDNKYDHVNVDEILVNDRLRNQYVRCILETGPCITGDAKFLKEKMPETIVTKCKKCTAKQMEFFSKITEWFIANDPETWNLLLRHVIEQYQKKN